MVAAQQQEPDLRLDHFALLVEHIGRQHQGFDGLRQRQMQQLGHFFARAFAGRGHAGHRLAGRCTHRGGCQRLGFFHVGGVITAGAVHDGVFASSGNHLKLFAQIAANGAAVSRHRAITQTKPIKNFAIRIGHDLVALLGADRVAVKAVGVFHDEFTTTHQAKARPAFITKLGLNLVKIFGQLLVAAQFLASNVGHHLFAGGLHHKIAPMSIFDAQQLRPHLVKTSRLLPKL